MSNNKIYPVDPLGRNNRRSCQCLQTITNVQNWVQGMRKVRRDNTKKLVLSFKPEYELQNDTMSCGVFVFAYVYFMLFFGRLPNPGEFNRGRSHIAIRIVMQDILTDGTVKAPLVQYVHIGNANASRRVAANDAARRALVLDNRRQKRVQYLIQGSNDVQLIVDLVNKDNKNQDIICLK